MSKKGKVEVLDSLFRDGMQHGKMRISFAKACEVIQLISRSGIHIAELGFACSNPFAQRLIQAALKMDLGEMEVAAFGRTRKPQEKVEDCIDVKAILKLGVPVAVIVCKSRLFDVHHDLKTKAPTNLAMIRDTVEYLKSQGLKFYLDLEHSLDAFYGRAEFGQPMSSSYARRNRQHFFEVVKTGIRAGADCLVVCDTTGGASPEEVANLFDILVQKHPETRFGFHGHDDNSLAVANSRAAVMHGACHVQGTINGFGERCGNLNLCTFIPRMQLKDRIDIVSPSALEGFTELSVRTARAFRREPSYRAPFVGVGATKTLAGMHAATEGKRNGAYLPFLPFAVGNIGRIGVNQQSGKANVRMAARDLGVPLTPDQVGELMRRYEMTINCGGFEESEVSFLLACRRIRGDHQPFFTVVEYEVTTGESHGHTFAKAEVTVRVGDQEESAIAKHAKGPVDALAVALYKALGRFYIEIKNIHLETFSLDALDVPSSETEAPVIVTATFSAGDTDWRVSGVDPNSEKAALQALSDSIEYYLTRKGNGNQNGSKEG